MRKSHLLNTFKTMASWSSTLRAPTLQRQQRNAAKAASWPEKIKVTLEQRWKHSRHIALGLERSLNMITTAGGNNTSTFGRWMIRLWSCNIFNFKILFVRTVINWCWITKNNGTSDFLINIFTFTLTCPAKKGSITKQQQQKLEGGIAPLSGHAWKLSIKSNAK